MPGGLRDQNWKCCNTPCTPLAKNKHILLWFFSNKAHFHDIYIYKINIKQNQKKTLKKVAKYLYGHLPTAAIVMLFLTFHV